MEFRKLILFGKNSLIISLPSRWLTKNKLRKGDTVSVEDSADSLIISSGTLLPQTEEKIANIDANKKSLDLIKVEIIAAYLNNYDTIKIIGSDVKNNYDEIKKIIRSLSGLEIVDQTTSRITAKDILDEKSISIAVMIKRIDMIIRGMIDDSINCVDENLYESIFQRDIDVNRLVFLTFRVLRNSLINTKVAKVLELRPIDVLRSWQLVHSLEEIGDHNKRMARLLNESKCLKNIKMSKAHKEKFIHLCKMLKKNYLDVMNAYYKKDRDLVFKVELESKERVKALEDFLKSTPDSEILARIIKNMKSMSGSIKSIARTIIDMES